MQQTNLLTLSQPPNTIQPSIVKNTTKLLFEQLQLTSLSINKHFSSLHRFTESFQINYYQENDKIQHLTWYVYPAFDNTFIIRPRKAKDKVLKHIDSNGLIIKQLQIQGLYSLHMFTAEEVTIWIKQNNKKQYRILQWNLKKNIVLNYVWKTMLVGTLEFITFSDTKLMCIIQKSLKEVKISYLKAPLITENDSTLFQLHLKKFPQRLRFVGKINNHSGIAWVKISLQTNQLIFHKLDLRTNTYNIETFTLQNPNKQNKFLQLQDIWQPQLGLLYLRFRGQYTSPDHFATHYHNYLHHRDVNTLLYQQKFIYDVMWEYQKGNNLRMMDFIKQHIKKKEYIVQFMNGYRGKNHIVFRDVGQNNDVIKFVGLNPDIIFIDGQDYDKISLIQHPKKYVIQPSQLQFYDFCCPLYDNFVYMEQNTKYIKNKIIFNIKFIKFMPITNLKIIHSYFMTEIVDHCDDDLICQVVELSSVKRVNQIENQQSSQMQQEIYQMEQMIPQNL